MAVRPIWADLRAGDPGIIDVTGKECPKYYVDHPDAWEQMKADISAQITIDQGLMGIS